MSDTSSPRSGSGEEESHTSDLEPVAPSEPPQSLRRAAGLMCIGAALSVLEVLPTFLARDEIRDAVAASQSGFSAEDADAFTNLTITLSVVFSLIAAAIWLWMAHANKAGRSWARVVASVLGGIDIVHRLFMLTSSAGLTLIINVLTIALAGYILYLLHRPESSAYYVAIRDGRR